MGDMGYGYGSEWHLLRYLGRHRQQLNDLIKSIETLKPLNVESVEWLDSNHSENHWTLDAEWKRLDFLPEDHPARAKWPSVLNPNWDAVGRLGWSDSGREKE